MAYRNTQSYENLERRIYEGVGEYGVPELQPILFEGESEFIGFNYAMSSKKRKAKSVHFFYRRLSI